MNTDSKVHNSPETSEEEQFFQRRPVLIYQEHDMLTYSHGFCSQLFTRKQLNYLKKRIDETLEYYDRLNSTDEFIQDINNKSYDNAFESQSKDMRPKEEKKAPRKGYIYLIQNTVNKALKIGFSKNPDTRLQQLNTASPEPLELICSKKGTLDEEKSIHEELNHLRLNTEWYPETQEVYKYF